MSRYILTRISNISPYNDFFISYQMEFDSFIVHVYFYSVASIHICILLYLNEKETRLGKDILGAKNRTTNFMCAKFHLELHPSFISFRIQRQKGK